MAESLDDALLREQVALALAQTRRVRLPHSLVDLALSAIAWQSGAETAALVYLPLMTLAHWGRSAWLAHRQAAGTPAALLRRDMQALLAVLGLIKAALTCAVLAQPSSDWQALLTIVLLGNAAAAITTAGGDRNTYLSWALPFSSGLVAGWMGHGGPAGLGMALLVPVMLMVLADYVSDQGEGQRRLLRANAALREANAARTRFFAAAGHDLRQPLTALAYGAATVKAVAQQRADEVLNEVADGLQRGLAESHRLLEDLLDVSRLEAGSVEPTPEPVDLAALLHELVKTLRPTAAKGQVALLADAPPSAEAAWVDPQLLRRVLNNLTGNALQFTPPGGRVLLRLRSRHSGSCVVEVIDTGPGIPPEMQERVFEPFFQAAPDGKDGAQGSRQGRGLGLGLAIVRRLVDLMGLQLHLESAPGAGCRFALQIPMAPPGPQPAGAEAAG